MGRRPGRVLAALLVACHESYASALSRGGNVGRLPGTPSHATAVAVGWRCAGGTSHVEGQCRTHWSQVEISQAMNTTVGCLT
jgi:hypothetical protein